MEVDVVAEIRTVAAVDENLETVAAGDVLDDVVGDVVRTVAVDVDAVVFLRVAAGDVVDVVAIPERVGRVAVDGGGFRGVRRGGGAQIIFDDAPVIAADLHRDGPRVAARFDAQTGDGDVMPAGKTAGGVDAGNRALVHGF